jgi:hypothetical protein
VPIDTTVRGAGEAFRTRMSGGVHRADWSISRFCGHRLRRSVD